jgi:hypothetical protein
MHTDIHALTCLRAMRMDCIASEEDTVMSTKLRANSLSYAICRPPMTVLVVDLVRAKDLVCSIK